MSLDSRANKGNSIKADFWPYVTGVLEVLRIEP